MSGLQPDGSWLIPVPPGAATVSLRFAPAPSTPPATPPSPPTAPPGAWAPPIGIPEPSFGIREVAPALPAAWTIEVPGFLYVNNSTGSDLRALGTPALPRKTIPPILAAGAVVVVAGSYEHAPMGYSNIGGAGSKAQPIFIVGAAGLRATFKRELHVVGSYIILENLAFADLDGSLCGTPVLLAPAHHVCIRDCEISGNKKAGGALLVSWDGQRGGDFVLLRCNVHDCGDWKTTLDQDKHGVGIGNVDHVWVLDCEFTRCSGDGVQVNGGQAGQARTHHVYVGRCLAYQNKQTGLWCKQAVDVVFSENVIYNHRPSPSTPNGAGMGFQYATERIWFLWNQITGCDTGIFSGSDSGLGTGVEVWLVKNRVAAVHHSTTPHDPLSAWSNGAAVLLAGGREPWVIGNTFDDCDAGVASPNVGAAVHLGDNVMTRIGPGKPERISGAIVRELNGMQKARDRFQQLYGISLP